jgi:hypothetical protein
VINIEISVPDGWMVFCESYDPCCQLLGPVRWYRDGENSEINHKKITKKSKNQKIVKTN